MLVLNILHFFVIYFFLNIFWEGKKYTMIRDTSAGIGFFHAFNKCQQLVRTMSAVLIVL